MGGAPLATRLYRADVFVFDLTYNGRHLYDRKHAIKLLNGKAGNRTRKAGDAD